MSKRSRRRGRREERREEKKTRNVKWCWSWWKWAKRQMNHALYTLFYAYLSDSFQWSIRQTERVGELGLSTYLEHDHWYCDYRCDRHIENHLLKRRKQWRLVEQQTRKKQEARANKKINRSSYYTGEISFWSNEGCCRKNDLLRGKLKNRLARTSPSSNHSSRCIVAFLTTEDKLSRERRPLAAQQGRLSKQVKGERENVL